MAKCSSSQSCHVPLRGVLTVIGGFLVHTTISTGYIFGNLNPYLTSYLRARSESSNASYTDTIWISTVTYVAESGSMPILGLLDQKIPPRYCALIGGLILNAGYALTYFTMKQSIILTALTYGLLSGLGKGMTYCTAIKTALLWFPERAGLVTGFINCGQGVGTFVFNQIITQLINPENTSPDLEVDNEDLYFTQDTLLDRVPVCFLLLAGIYTGIQLFAVMALMWPPPQTDTDTTNEEEDIHGESENMFTVTEELSDDLAEVQTRDSESAISKKENDVNFTPLQMLRTRLFYIMWTMFTGVVLGVFFVINFYKTFAQTFIKDDHFLALAGSVGSAANALGRPTWGAVGDKLGYRESLVIVIAIFGAAGVTFNLCEYGGKPMLMIWLILLYGTFSGFYALMPSLTLKLWGHRYYSTNYGLIGSGMVLIQLIATLLTSQVKSAIGWRGILYIGAGGIIFSFVVALGMLIQHRRSRKYNDKAVKTTMDNNSNTAMQQYSNDDNGFVSEQNRRLK